MHVQVAQRAVAVSSSDSNSSTQVSVERKEEPILKRDYLQQPIPMRLLVLCALLFHGPLLLMHLPAKSFDANFHMSMAAHYAHHWFNPWNEKAFAGFSQATYPPLTHQWIALLSHAVGLVNAYMLVQGAVLLLLPVGVYRFCRLWVDERAAGYGAFLSIFLGSLCLLVYLDGQIGTVSSSVLFLLALSYLHGYIVDGRLRELALGVSICCTAAAAHHATLLFGMGFFIPPVLCLAWMDTDRQRPGWRLTACKRVGAFGALAGTGIALVLLPYLAALLKHPIDEVVIPHTSRANYLLSPVWGVHYFLVPYGLLVPALPFIFSKGVPRRLFSLLCGFYMAFLFSLGGTTPVPRFLLGRVFDVLTLERFSFWALLLAMPFAGLLAAQLIDRFRVRAAYALATAAVGGASLAVSWNVYFPLLAPQPDVQPIIRFLNEKGHDRYRYLTLGYPNGISRIMCYTEASSVDGEYNSGRTLPELTRHAVAQLTTARFYGAEGTAALREMLSAAPRYGLRYIFVHDHVYDPLLTFGGWRPIEALDERGTTIVWTTLGIPPATPISSPLKPPGWQGVLWGVLPFGSSILTLFLLYLYRPTGEPDRKPSPAHAASSL